MRWVLLWSLLILGAGLFLTLIVRGLWGQLKALRAQLDDAARRTRDAAPTKRGRPGF